MRIFAFRSLILQHPGKVNTCGLTPACQMIGILVVLSKILSRICKLISADIKQVLVDLWYGKCAYKTKDWSYLWQKVGIAYVFVIEMTARIVFTKFPSAQVSSLEWLVKKLSLRARLTACPKCVLTNQSKEGQFPKTWICHIPRRADSVHTP